VDPAPHCRFWRSPDRFDPSRIMPDAAPPPRFAYMPFGAGLRICVGGRFALTELVLVVANLARTFRIDLPPHRPVAPV
jgi:cytochrome P450